MLIRFGFGLLHIGRPSGVGSHRYHAAITLCLGYRGEVPPGELPWRRIWSIIHFKFRHFSRQHLNMVNRSLSCAVPPCMSARRSAGSNFKIRPGKLDNGPCASARRQRRSRINVLVGGVNFIFSKELP